MAKKILVVDDSATVRQTVRMALDKAGYANIAAVDGLDALKVLENESVDMVITDLNMPNLDGFGLTRELRQNQKTRFTPIIILTTETDQEKKALGKAAGASGWLEKPFNPNNLLKIVRLALG